MSHRSKEAEVRAAMGRLLAGSPLHTAGRLDATSLAAEAGVSRQDLYRTYRNVLDEFRAHVVRLAQSGPVPRRRDPEALAAELAETSVRAARYRSERDAARRERDANASRVVYLEDQNRQLHEALASVQGLTSLFAQSKG